MKKETYICSDCGNPCEPIVIDTGIGGYEFWGQRGIDSHKEVLSNCCQASVKNEEGKIITNADNYYED